ncbi:MAG: hypothetical protein DRP95_04490 [Candidatus Latescibacterota bacterium]|nr:MAG: hypothetical protein DRP95_04490 [Candidatus Latescibacterota bacterium]
MRKLVEKVLIMDRRVIYALMASVALLPLVIGPLGLPSKVSPEVKAVYERIESLPEGAPFLISMDFDPASKPELYPMAEALVRHAFRKNLRVIGMNLWITGSGMAERILSDVAEEYGKRYGEDYVYLGWAPGAANVILGLGQDLYKTFPRDYYGNLTSELPVLNGINTLRDIPFMVDLAAGDPGIETWVVYGKARSMAGGCTAVIAPGMYAFLNSGQLVGLIGGMRGAAEYEALLEKPGKATVGMDIQSTTHILILALILLSNIAFFATGRRGR